MSEHIPTLATRDRRARAVASPNRAAGRRERRVHVAPHGTRARPRQRCVRVAERDAPERTHRYASVSSARSRRRRRRNPSGPGLARRVESERREHARTASPRAGGPATAQRSRRSRAGWRERASVWTRDGARERLRHRRRRRRQTRRVPRDAAPRRSLPPSTRRPRRRNTRTTRDREGRQFEIHAIAGRHPRERSSKEDAIRGRRRRREARPARDEDGSPRAVPSPSPSPSPRGSPRGSLVGSCSPWRFVFRGRWSRGRSGSVSVVVPELDAGR